MNIHEIRERWICKHVHRVSSKVAREDMKGGEQYGRRAGSSRKGLGAFPSTSLIWISLGEDSGLSSRRTKAGRASGCNGWKWKIRGKWKCLWLSIMLRGNGDFGNRKDEDDPLEYRFNDEGAVAVLFKDCKKKIRTWIFFSGNIILYEIQRENHAKFNQLIKRDGNWICK